MPGTLGFPVRRDPGDHDPGSKLSSTLANPGLVGAQVKLQTFPFRCTHGATLGAQLLATRFESAGDTPASLNKPDMPGAARANSVAVPVWEGSLSCRSAGGFAGRRRCPPHAPMRINDPINRAPLETHRREHNALLCNSPRLPRFMADPIGIHCALHISIVGSCG